MIFVESTLKNLTHEYRLAYPKDFPEELRRRVKRLGQQLTTQPRPLMDLLPASLQKLDLCLKGGKDYWNAEDLFKMAPLLKTERIPHLSRIVLQGAIMFSEETKRAWQDVGVQIH